jgi:hypothetical protein
MHAEALAWRRWRLGAIGLVGLMRLWRRSSHASILIHQLFKSMLCAIYFHVFYIFIVIRDLTLGATYYVRRLS